MTIRDGDIDLLQADGAQEPDPLRDYQKVIELRREPRWILRMREQGLPVQDSTSRVTHPDDAA